MRRPTFVFGGCAYRKQVSCEHAGALAMLSAQATVRDAGPMLASVNYLHTSNLPQGRCVWLREAIEDRERPTWAVSVDSDTTFSAGQLLHELPVVDGQVAIGLAAVRIGGTESLCNLCLTEKDEHVSMLVDDKGGGLRGVPNIGRRMFHHELVAILAGDRLIASGGFGVAVFNLAWFRQCWPKPVPENITFEVGEDIAFCQSVRARGGLIAALKVTTDHFAWGEKQTR